MVSPKIEILSTVDVITTSSAGTSGKTEIPNTGISNTGDWDWKDTDRLWNIFPSIFRREDILQ